jgi:1-deoxy-D-xylulose-5-phosphate reductoisomerase
LDIISEYNKRFRAYLLTANRSVDLLIAQAKKYLPRKVIIADELLYETLRSELEGYPIEVAAGSKAIAEAVADTKIDIVVTAMVGYSGLEPTISAIKAGKTIALANKETLVVAGELITSLLAQYDAKIIPVDSEHSAIFQCLEGEKTEHAEKIILTASGGPFRTRSLADLEHVTVRDALRHPNWDMGAKVTIDSASMMNKGFEMIEAHWLFGCPAKQIEVVVHPQSIVHSMVAFSDGSIKAQLGVPDMHLPIRYALGYPERLSTEHPPLSLSQYSTLTFEAPDLQKYPLLSYAFDAIEKGGNVPCVLNAANEIAVAAFLCDSIRFTDMPKIAAETMQKIDFIVRPTYDDYVATNLEARAYAESLLTKYRK